MQRVKENEYYDVARGSSSKYIAGGINECTLCAGVCSEARIKGFVYLMSIQVLVELAGISFSRTLLKKRKLELIECC